jgi:membrane protein implicated in regulation of membrane protease activity
MVNDVQGVREMLAGQVLVSAVAGLAAMVVTVVLSAPILATVVAYPAVCSLTLLLMSAVWNIRSVNLRRSDAYFRA